MDTPFQKTIGFIGLGLIGGSIALSLKERHPDYRLVAYQYRKNSTDRNLKQALKDQILDEVYTDLSPGFSHCDMIFLCAPVLSNISYLSELNSLIKPSCILTDVGSVKGNIYDAVKKLQLERNFIGGHPMAGSEKTGYANASNRLLENAYYILTPTALTSASMKDLMEQTVLDTGAIPVWLNAGEHDDITAAISHVPHIMAAALVNMVKHADNQKEQMRILAAGGFRDITRIASSSPVMWQNICLGNRDSICRFLSLYCSSLRRLEQALKEESAVYLHDFFAEAREYRNTIPDKSVGIISKVFELYMDIADETGAIAAVASLLAAHAVSIKNIGIIHNREFEDGALRIEFYDLSSSLQAAVLLEKNNYTIFEH